MKKIMALTLVGAVALFTATSATAAYASGPGCKSDAMAGMKNSGPSKSATMAQDKHQNHHQMDKMTPKTGANKSPKKSAAMNMQGKKNAPITKKKATNMKKQPAMNNDKKKSMDMKDMDMDMDEDMDM